MGYSSCLCELLSSSLWWKLSPDAPLFPGSLVRHLGRLILDSTTTIVISSWQSFSWMVCGSRSCTGGQWLRLNYNNLICDLRWTLSSIPGTSNLDSFSAFNLLKMSSCDPLLRLEITVVSGLVLPLYLFIRHLSADWHILLGRPTPSLSNCCYLSLANSFSRPPYLLYLFWELSPFSPQKFAGLLFRSLVGSSLFPGFSFREFWVIVTCVAWLTFRPIPSFLFHLGPCVRQSHHGYYIPWCSRLGAARYFARWVLNGKTRLIGNLALLYATLRCFLGSSEVVFG